METDFEKSLKAASERTTAGSSMISKKAETKVAQGFEENFGEFKYDAAKFFGGLNTSFSEPTLCALHEIANCIGILSNRLTSVCAPSSVKPSVFSPGTNAETTGTAP